MKPVIKFGIVNIFILLLNNFASQTERCKFTFVFDEKTPFTQFFAKESVILMQKQCYKMRVTLLIIAITLTFQVISQSETTIAPKYSNEFLAIGVGADALGLSNSVVAQTEGVTSGYWNPAGLTQTKKWLDVSLMHSEYFAGIAKYDYIGLAHQIDKKSSAGFSMIRFAVDDIPNTTQLIDNDGNIDYDRITTFTAADYAFLFSYASVLPIKGLSVGGNIKIIHRKVGDFAKSWGFGIDAGAQYAIKNSKFGVVVRDVTSTFNAWVFTLDDATKEVFQSTGNSLPENGLELTLPRIILAAYHKKTIGEKGFYASGEIDCDITTDKRRNTLIQSNLISIDPHVGLAIGFKDFVTLRGGIGNMQYITNFDNSKTLTLQPNIGIGLKVKNISLDYAFTDIGDASTALYSHVISLKLLLNNPVK